MPNRFRFILVALILGGIGFYLVQQSRTTPSLPALSPRAGETVPSAEFLNVAATAEHYREQIARYPEVTENYVALANLFLQETRVTGAEATYIPRVQSLIDRALERNPDHAHAQALQASLYAKLHRFEDARDLAQTLIERHPYFAFPYGILVDALVELGAYEEAVEAADKAVSLRPDLASYARISYLRELHGDSDGAIRAMTRAAEAGAPGRENRAWALSTLAHLYLAESKLDTARYIFEGVLEERPGYAVAYAGLGHVALVEGRYGEAVGLIQTAYQVTPNAGFLELLSETYATAGDLVRADSVDERILDALAEEARIGFNIDMEYADFCADREIHLAEALGRAEREIERRPDHLHALETYAWALHKNGRSTEALPYIERAMRLGNEDAMVDFRAAHIFRAAGQPEAATRHFRLAVDRGLHLESPTAAREARALLTG